MRLRRCYGLGAEGATSSAARMLDFVAVDDELIRLANCNFVLELAMNGILCASADVKMCRACLL